MVIIKSYRLRKDGSGKLHVISYEISTCPVCGHALFVIGIRERKYIKDDGIQEILVIRRLRCKDCLKIHHELPGILAPYKRHSIDTIEKAISGDVGDICCEARTVQRIKAWWEGCRLYFESVLASLRAKYGDVFSLSPAPREIIRAVANAHLWIHTRSAFLSG
jgi:hypothetical protein